MENLFFRSWKSKGSKESEDIRVSFTYVPERFNSVWKKWLRLSPERF